LSRSPEVVISYNVISFTSGPVAPGAVGRPFGYAYTTVGDSNVGYAVTSGGLPPGLSLSAGGVLSGTPTAAGDYVYTVTATGATAFAVRQDSINISPAPSAAVSTSGTSGSLTIACPAFPADVCAGTVTLAVAEHRSGGSVVAVSARKRSTHPTVKVVKVEVGRATFSVNPGQTGTIEVALNATGRTLLSEFYSLPTTATFSGTSLPSQMVTFAYRRLTTSVSWSWGWINEPCSVCYTTVKKLTVVALPAHARILVLCHGGGCPFGQRTAIGHSARLPLVSWFAGSRLLPGTVLEIRVTVPNSIGKVFVYTMVAGNQPDIGQRCLPPGIRNPVTCLA
jgi:hypothetical protein